MENPFAWIERANGDVELAIPDLTLNWTDGSGQVSFWFDGIEMRGGDELNITFDAPAGQIFGGKIEPSEEPD